MEDFLGSRLVAKDWESGKYSMAYTWNHKNREIPLFIEKVRVGDNIDDNLLRKAVHLRKVALGSSKITDKGIETLVNLDLLSINNVVTITDGGIRNMKHLQELNVGNCKITDDGILSFPKLKILSLNNSFITQKTINKIPTLEELYLYANTTFATISNRNIRILYISKIKPDISSLNLTELTGYQCGIQDSDIQSMINLTKLRIIGASLITNQSISKLTKLKRLELVISSIDDEVFENLGELEYLSLCRCENVSDRGIRLLKKLKYLSSTRCPKITIKI